MKKSIIKIIFIVLILTLSVSMVACVPTSPEKAKEKLEKAGYTVAIIDDTLELNFIKIIGFDKVESIVTALKKDSDEGSVVIIYCENSESAKEYRNKIEDLLTKLSITNKDEMATKISGSIIYSGDELGLKDLK